MEEVVLVSHMILFTFSYLTKVITLTLSLLIFYLTPTVQLPIPQPDHSD